MCLAVVSSKYDQDEDESDEAEHERDDEACIAGGSSSIPGEANAHGDGEGGRRSAKVTQ